MIPGRRDGYNDEGKPGNEGRPRRIGKSPTLHGTRHIDPNPTHNHFFGKSIALTNPTSLVPILVALVGFMVTVTTT